MSDETSQTDIDGDLPSHLIPIVSSEYGTEQIDAFGTDEDINCELCGAFSTNSFDDLAIHLMENHNITFDEYLTTTPLHRCPVCDSQLDSLDQLACENCDLQADRNANIKIPCQYCGEKLEPVRDPFCSPTCAATRLQYGPLFQPPRGVDEQWSTHPYRLDTGIPNATPILHRYEYVCRHCYLFGTNDEVSLATHVGSKHDISWAAYIERYPLEPCRSSNRPLDSLT